MKQNNWTANPTKKQFILSVTLYFVSVFLLTVALTNFYEERIDLQKHFLSLLVIFFATLMVGKVTVNYFKNS